MNVTLGKAGMAREDFFLWAHAQDTRHEFDGFRPVAMTGGTIGHSRIVLNIHHALHARLAGGRCEPLGPDAGLATIGDAVRYPDALITCTKVPDHAHLVPGVCVVFEVLSKTSAYVDRIIKVREYQGVPSILRYVIVEASFTGATVLHRPEGAHPWTIDTLAEGDVLVIPEAGIALPINEIYANVEHGEPA